MYPLRADSPLRYRGYFEHRPLAEHDAHWMCITVLQAPTEVNCGRECRDSISVVISGHSSGVGSHSPPWQRPTHPRTPQPHIPSAMVGTNTTANPSLRKRKPLEKSDKSSSKSDSTQTLVRPWHTRSRTDPNILTLYPCSLTRAIGERSSECFLYSHYVY